MGVVVESTLWITLFLGLGMIGYGTGRYDEHESILRYDSFMDALCAIALFSSGLRLAVGYGALIG